MKAAIETEPLPETLLAITAGSFTPAAESLKHYQTPEWYRDAKFGIWAHWGPQAVPRAGDWYALNMYLQGHPQYEHHLKAYGHPSHFGYKDIIALWKAEKWDPDALMALYAKAGAKYFVSMGVHRDNFDLWKSKYHRWNSVNMGPKRDIVGEWKHAAEKAGLRFGVSEHLGPSYSWFSPSHGWDQYGPMQGAFYDGANPANADLYHPAHNEPFHWGGRGMRPIRGGIKNGSVGSRIFSININQISYILTEGIPFEDVGRSLLAHFYNSNQVAHGGKLEAVYAFKDLGTGEVIPEAGVLDIERGKGRHHLASDQIDLIVRQIEDRCRDVTD